MLNITTLLKSFALVTSLTLCSTAFASESNAKKIPVKPSYQQGEDRHFVDWREVQNFISTMQTEHHFELEQLNTIFKQARYLESSIQLIKPAPLNKPKNWKAYRARFVENGRIEAGSAFWERNTEYLQRAEKEYGVPAEIIVGLIGVETIYGKTTGNFRAIDSLTTLAFSYPNTANREARMAFFRSELMQLLLWSKESKTELFSIKGSYAGALGLAQFMPSSLRQYAVDFDGDGTINLSNSEADAIGSIANYLAKHGWKKGLPYTFPATHVGQDEDKLRELLSQGLKASYQLEQIKQTITAADPLIPTQLLYGVVDLQNGPDPSEYWLATENFFAITQYNRSYFYAMSVVDLGQVIALTRKKE
ncbi:MAG: lytic murein transglycosylase B [Undibacterium sp.]|nr:lytic murein transglycosylase B [Undibacterium sp.]